MKSHPTARPRPPGSKIYDKVLNVIRDQRIKSAKPADAKK